MTGYLNRDEGGSAAPDDHTAESGRVLILIASFLPMAGEKREQVDLKDGRNRKRLRATSTGVPHSPKSSRESNKDRSLLPCCSGPKLGPFSLKDLDIEFIELLSSPATAADSHVFRIRIGGDEYALKVVSIFPRPYCTIG